MTPTSRSRRPRVTLTPSNWNTGVTVTVAAAEDADTVGGTATITASATGLAPLAVTATEIDNDTPGGDNAYIAKFLEQYGKIKNSGYFSPEGVPYHSIETLIVEAPDQGHETTSEAFSYWLWLEAELRPGHPGLGAVQQRLDGDGEVHHPVARRPAHRRRPTRQARSTPRSTTCPASTRRR